MLVDDLDIFGIVGVSPSEADAPLIVDPDAHLAGAIAFQGFEPVPRRITKVIDRGGSIKLTKLTQRATLDIARELAARQALQIRSVSLHLNERITVRPQTSHDT